MVHSLSFPRPIIKSHTEQKVRVAFGLGTSQNFGFPYNISAMAEAIDFKLGIQLGFAHHKITQITKVGHGMVLD